jgi:hypothetical protein
VKLIHQKRSNMKTLSTLLIIGFFWIDSNSQTGLPVPSLQPVIHGSNSAPVVLRWDAPTTNVLGFVVEKKEGGRPWLIIGQTEPEERSFTDNKVSGTVAYYRVRAYGSKVLSEYSVVRSIRNSSNDATPSNPSRQ